MYSKHFTELKMSKYKYINNHFKISLISIYRQMPYTYTVFDLVTKPIWFIALQKNYQTKMPFYIQFMKEIGYS